MHFETKAIHAGIDVANESRSIVPPISPSTIFELDEKGRNENDLHYTRLDNPNRMQLETLLKTLEEGEAAAAFSSGVAAASAILQSLDPGDHILMPEDIYAGNRKLTEKILVRWGLDVDFIQLSNLETVQKSVKENTRMIWIETPSNPMMRITDIRATAKLATGRNILVCVDNTWPSPVNQLPLILGADLVLHSTSKYFGGHSDILGGAVISKRNDAFFERIRLVQRAAGAVPSPYDCWLLCRSTRTLPYRMRGHNDHATSVADFLSNHPRVKTVLYPGLPSHPGHEIAKKQMAGYGGMISFLIDGGQSEAVEAVGKATLIKRATSLGGVESTWEHRRSSEGEGSVTPDNLIRLSVGLEHPDDLIEDLDRALS